MSGRMRCGVTRNPVARESAITRSGGMPFSPHFETAWGEIGGSKIAPMAEYGPRAAVRSSSGVVASMNRIMNRRLTAVNCELLPRPPALMDHQRMVEPLSERLKQIKGDMSLAAFGELAGVSAQAADKWLKGGNVTDKNLALIAEKCGVTLQWLRYGNAPRKPGASKDLSDLTQDAIEVARAWMSLPDYKQRGYAQGIMVDAAVCNLFPEIEKAMRLAAVATSPNYHKTTEKFMKAREQLARQFTLDLEAKSDP